MPGASDDVRALVARHVPVLALATDDYEPIDARIYLNDATATRIAGRCVTELTPRSTALSVGECVGQATLPRGPSRGAVRLDVTGLDVTNEAGYRQLYGLLAPEYGRVTYANVRMKPSDVVVINYWLFYFFNFNAGPFGNHEGDWERVQVRITAASAAEALQLDPAQDSDRFALAISRHRCDSTAKMPSRPWAAIEADGAHPVVYVAQGSHANYFEPGFKRLAHDGVQCTVADNAHGEPALSRNRC